MGINLINSQGTVLYVLTKPSTPWADCTEAIAAIKAGKQVLCPQDLGEIQRTRAIKEYSCMSSNEIYKSGGSMTLGEVTIGMLFDPQDQDGQDHIYQSMEDNKQIVFAFELPDADTTSGENGASGTIFWYEAIISGDAISVPIDEAVLYTATLSLMGEQNRCEAVPGQP